MTKNVIAFFAVFFTMFFSGSLMRAELVAHWPLDIDGSDVVGNHNGVIHESVGFSSSGANSNSAGSATFSGAGGIQVPFDLALNPSNFTLTAWVNPTDSEGWNSVVTNREANGTTVNGYVLYNTPDYEWDFWTGAGGPNGAWGRNVGPVASLNEWTHLAITYDEATDTKSLFVNAELSAQVSGQGFVPNGTTEQTQRPFNIGAGQDSGIDFFFNGQIDDIGLYNSALSAGEIGSIMANGVAIVPEPESALLMILGILCLARCRHGKTS